MKKDEIINWLLQGDVSIQFQVYRDILDENHPELQERIESEGWGARYLSARLPNAHWGNKFYHPKWTSSHYTLLDLKNLYLKPDNDKIRETIELIVKYERGMDGGITPSIKFGIPRYSDVCINGMFLNYSCYFGIEEEKLHPIVDFILSQNMPDGGYNCRLNRSGAVHSSLHTTISTLEGITEYYKNGYKYRLNELLDSAISSREFILMHRLFLSDHSGEIINPNFLKLSYPFRWYYDILRALDHFQYAGFEWDERMGPALEIILQKRRKDGKWNVQARHPGQIHFEMEKAGKASRWNTLRAMRVLKHFNKTNNI